MSLKAYQKEVDNWIKKQMKTGYFPPLSIIARLAEETGELAREINHKYGPKKKKPTENKQDIGEEIADIFFTLICLANSLDIDIDDAFKKKMKKLKSRDKNRFK